jgi:hypothetical protein
LAPAGELKNLLAGIVAHARILAVMHGAQDRLMMEQEWNDGITPLST